MNTIIKTIGLLKFIPLPLSLDENKNEITNATIPPTTQIGIKFGSLFPKVDAINLLLISIKSIVKMLFIFT